MLVGEPLAAVQVNVIPAADAKDRAKTCAIRVHKNTVPMAKILILLKTTSFVFISVLSLCMFYFYKFLL
jgi:hypothetical protein